VQSSNSPARRVTARGFLFPPTIQRKGITMALQLEANYSKKLGLPGYSSHQYSVTLRLEVSDIKQVEAESARLYALLQGCVDRDIQEAGFLPTNGNGASNGSHQNGSNGHSHGHANGHSNGHHGTNGNGNGRPNGQSEAWSCSDKQRSLILKIVEDHRLDKQDIDALAQERFGKGVRQLNKMEASGLIEELLETHGGNAGNNGSRSNGGRFQKARTA
jgi:hypothetical protein